MKSMIMPSTRCLTYAVLLQTTVRASMVTTAWNKIDFFAIRVNETMSQVDVTPPACPTLRSDVFCSTDWDPYICGTNACGYSNYCDAEGSGFNVTTECEKSIVTESAVASCPDWLTPDFFCAAYWDPYECGPNNCEYGNECEATLAGFNVTTNCTSSVMSEPSMSPTRKPNCPSIPEDLFCEESWKPYLCVDSCRYSNDCYASASGFNVTSDCIELPLWGGTTHFLDIDAWLTVTCIHSFIYMYKTYRLVWNATGLCTPVAWHTEQNTINLLMHIWSHIHFAHWISLCRNNIYIYWYSVNDKSCYG